MTKSHLLSSFYVYREYRTKQFIKFSPDRQTLTYNQTKVFYFDPAASGPGLDESDTICTINIPFIVCQIKMVYLIYLIYLPDPYSQLFMHSNVTLYYSIDTT